MNFRTYVCWYLINFYVKLGFWWAMLWDSEYSIVLDNVDVLIYAGRVLRRRILYIRPESRCTCCTYAIVYTQVATPAPVPVLTVYVAVCLKALLTLMRQERVAKGKGGGIASGGVFRTCARAAVVLDGGKGRKTVRRLRAWWGGQKRVWRGRVFIARRGRGLDGKKVYM